MSQEQDRRFIRNFIGVLAALALAGVLFGILANVLEGVYEPPGKREREIARLQAERLQPVGQVNTVNESSVAAAAAASDSATNSDARSGEQVFKQVCSACHAAQFMNAPQIGNKDEWAPRAKKGLGTLAAHALQGFGNMPPQGGAVSEAEVRAAIEYMVEDKTGIDLN
ncbi:MAG: cytochrome c5 family protein [Nitrococcus mobilis]|nr:cytochrome c5 family protein [Nitrococcus mobilis]